MHQTLLSSLCWWKVPSLSLDDALPEVSRWSLTYLHGNFLVLAGTGQARLAVRGTDP